MIHGCTNMIFFNRGEISFLKWPCNVLMLLFQKLINIQKAYFPINFAD